MRIIKVKRLEDSTLLEIREDLKDFRINEEYTESPTDLLCMKIYLGAVITATRRAFWFLFFAQTILLVLIVLNLFLLWNTKH